MPKPLTALLILTLFAARSYAGLPDSKLATNVRDSVWPKLKQELKNKGFTAPGQLYIRIFKQEHELEIWIKAGKEYRLFKTYEICFFTGGLGTKTREGDGKSPEGFYTIEAKQLNPVSNYHLAINIGYPNALEKHLGYTGNAIMVHGHCCSIGCYAMTDPFIDEIYTLVYQALNCGQAKINLHIFPFKMDHDRMALYSKYPQIKFWRNLKPAYDYFEAHHVPETVYFGKRAYAFK